METIVQAWQVRSPGPDIAGALRRVTSNTREDGRALLSFAAGHKLTVAVTPYPMAQAGVALADLAADRVNGAAVLIG